MRLLHLLLLSVALGVPATAALPPGTRYVMSHFRDNGGGGDERLYISISPDGLNWTGLNNGNPVYQPAGWQPFSNVVRDPAIIHANGYYWLAHTSGTYGHRDSSTTVTASFALVRSPDLLNWTHVAEVSTVTPGATDPLTWSPTFFRDGDGAVHVYVAIRPHGGSSYSPVPGMRVHELHPLNAAWTQWSTPVLVDLPSTNTNEFWVWKEGATYHGIYVDFTRGGSPFMHVTSPAPVSGWSNPRELGAYGREGGFVLKRPDGGYRVYTEGGNSTGSGYRCTDWNATFTAVSADFPMQSAVPMRNGKAIAAPDGTTYVDWSVAQLAGAPAAAREPQADADADGHRNVLEFATGRTPTQPEKAPILSPLAGGAVRYTRAAGAEADLALEISSDLQTWFSGAAYTRELSVTLRTDGTEEVLASVLPEFAVAPLFFRLRGTITSAPPPPMLTAAETKRLTPPRSLKRDPAKPSGRARPPTMPRPRSAGSPAPPGRAVPLRGSPAS